MSEVVLDAFIDGLKVLPFLFLIYLLMELIESARNKDKIEKALSGAGAPVMAGFLGIVPECGFAVAAAKLYDKRLIKIGTLVAAFLAVSDEGLIVLVSLGVNFVTILTFVAVKVVYAVFVGEIVNFLFAKKDESHVCPAEGVCIECGEHHEKPWDKFLLHPLFHTVKTGLYIIFFNLVFGFLIRFIGEERFYAFLGDNVYYQPLFAALVGLIPNCASSIVIAQAYAGGALSFAALLSGLSANAGLGMLILFNNRKKFKRNVAVPAIVFIAALVLGYATLPLKL